MSVPFLDLKSVYREIRDEVRPELEEVLESCGYILGPKVVAFEKAFAEIAGTRHCVAVSSGTAAVHLMIWASGLEPGSGIILPPNTFTATAEGIVLSGHVPVFVDVETRTYNLSPEKVASFLDENTTAGRPVDPKTGAVIRGIVAVDLYGQPADLGSLERIADRFGLTLYEDACQSHQASRDGRPAGSFGTAAAFSFYPGKNMGAFGEGGAVTTDSDELAGRIRMLRDHGSSEKYFYDLIGHNYRMEAIQGAVLGVKCRHIAEWNDMRRAAAARYGQLLGGLPLELPHEDESTRHVYHLYAIHSEKRDELRSWLEGRGVASGLHYPYPLHTQPAYAYLGYGTGDFPAAEFNSSRNITLPMFPGITRAQQEEVSGCMWEFFESKG
jgi:dTDP-4-amino-4,6-dideoxygalactose transaminase